MTFRSVSPTHRWATLNRTMAPPIEDRVAWPPDRGPLQDESSPLPKRPISLSVIVPEKQLLRRELTSSFGSRFWLQPVLTPARVEGRSWTKAAGVGPLPLLSPTGISRSQLLVASAAAGMPGLPSWSTKQGGLVRMGVGMFGGRHV